MSILKSPVFIVCCVLFVLHQLLQKGLQISLGYIDAYLDTFLAMPIVLTLLVAERRVLFKRGDNYRLTLPDVVIATFFIAVVSELVFSAFSDRFTPDWLDVICYVLGSILFYFFINPGRTQERA
jgi:predicted neutral ceramidase superfamily lipid hydrolase